MDYSSLDDTIRILTPGPLPIIITTRTIIQIAMTTQYLH